MPTVAYFNQVVWGFETTWKFLLSFPHVGLDLTSKLKAVGTIYRWLICIRESKSSSCTWSNGFIKNSVGSSVVGHVLLTISRYKALALASSRSASASSP